MNPPRRYVRDTTLQGADLLHPPKDVLLLARYCLIQWVFLLLVACMIGSCIAITIASAGPIITH